MVSLSIDPGLGGTGLAFWHDSKLRRCGILRCKNDRAPWEQRVKELGEAVVNAATELNVGAVAIEYPAFFGSVGGQMVAARGDLVKLATLVGFMAGRLHPVPVEFIPVNTWKGQLPKDVVEKRLRRMFPKFTSRFDVRSHMWDAIGVGVHAFLHKTLNN
jgi:Holliday junction resolvasome RuvABC endonuclease subunit